MARLRDDRRGDLVKGRRKAGGLLGELHESGGLLGGRRKVGGLLGNGPAVTLASYDALRREQPARGLVGVPGASPYALQDGARGLQNTMGFLPSINPTSGAERTERLRELRAALSGLMQEKGAAGSTAAVGDIDRLVGRPADTKSFSLADQISALGDATDDAMVGTARQDHRLPQQRTVRQVRDERNPIASGSGRAVRGLLGNVSPGRFAPYELPRHEQLAQGRAGLAGGLQDTSGFPPSVGLTPEAEETEQSKQLRADLSRLTQEAGADRGNTTFRNIDSFVRGAADTMSFGIADEIAALGDATVDAMMGNPWQYDRRLRQQRIAQRIRDDRDPIASGAGRLAGGLAGGLGLMKNGITLVGRSMPWLSSVAPKTAQTALGGLEGGAYGGAYGFGSGEGVDDRINQATNDALIGLGVGTATGALGNFIADGIARYRWPVPQRDLPRHVPPDGASERIGDVISDPTVREKVLDTINSGVDMGAKDWHDTERLRHLFVKELGKRKGNRAFRRFINFVAATSPGSDVGTNIRNASHYYQRDVQGLGAHEVGARIPWPYGHWLQRLHQINVKRVLDKGLDALRSPKIVSFGENLLGNLRPVAVDTHVLRLLGMLVQDTRFLKTHYRGGNGGPPLNIREMVESGEMSMEEALKRPAYWESIPKRDEYAAVERFFQDLGQEIGLEPAQAQVAAWIGGAKLTGLRSNPTFKFNDFFLDRVRRTVDYLNKDPGGKKISAEEVMRRFARGEMPLRSLIGLIAGTAVGLPGTEQRDGKQQRGAEPDNGRL